MTIFDVIRYPISEPPTQEEFENLPRAVYSRWVSAWNLDKKVFRPNDFARYYKLVYNATDHDFLPMYREKLLELRQMIKDYDNI